MIANEEKTDYRILTSSEIDNGYINWDALLNIKNDDVKINEIRKKMGAVVETPSIHHDLILQLPPLI